MAKPSLFALLGFPPASLGALCRNFGAVVSSQTSVMKRECYFCAFDFEDGTRLTPPEQSRAECFLKENVRLVHVQVLHPPAMLRLSESAVSTG